MNAPYHEGRWTRPDDLYAAPPPWDIGRPQPAFLALVEAGAIRGRVLDAGCGTGEHALLAAGLGLDATGIDLAATALRTAEEKARERGLKARFVQGDARRLEDLGERFDTVLDCGLFHVFDGEDRSAFVDGLRSVLEPGGRYFMLCFSDRQPGDGGPHRMSRKEIEAAFSEGWRVDSIEPATIEITTDPEGVRAWLVAATRVEAGDAEGTPLSAEARVPTDRAGRHLAQLCRHVSKMGRSSRHGLPARRGAGHVPPQVRDVECSDTEATISFELGRCVMRATPEALMLRVEATSAEDLRRLQELVGHRVETIGRRDELKVMWEGQEAIGQQRGPTTGMVRDHLARAAAHWRRPTGRLGVVLGAFATLLAAVHQVGGIFALVHLAPLALLATGVGLSRWLGWSTGLVATLVAAALATVVGLSRIILRRR